MKRTVGIIGMGWVGSSVAISTLHEGVCTELLVNDIRSELAEGEAMDLSHGEFFYPDASVRAVSVEEMRVADVVVICAGRGGRPDETRLQLLSDNAAIIRGIANRLHPFQGIVVVVSNPVDVLTQVFVEASGLPPARVLGTGTMLDTARLRKELAGVLHIAPSSVHAHVVGEHGDSEVILWSRAYAGGRPLRQWPDWQPEREPLIADRVRCAAGEIIRRKGATNHAIGLVTASLLSSIFRDDRRVLTVSRVQTEIPGAENVAFSLPAVVGADGASRILPLDMDDRERRALHDSVAVLRDARARIPDR